MRGHALTGGFFERPFTLGIVGWLAGMCCVVLGCGYSSNAGTLPSDGAQPATQARFISISDVFGALERPPVRFDHDRHTAALKTEGCKSCHRVLKSGDFSFAYSIAEGQNDGATLMNAYHDDCIGCHSKRATEGKKTGSVTCGGCHVVERQVRAHEYAPVMPDYYEVLRDTYHAECMTCHREPSKVAEDAGALDWKSFYLSHKKTEAEWPKLDFDYLVHDKHEKALEGKCELCHFIDPERMQTLREEGREPSGRDWVLDLDEENSLTERSTAHTRCINCHLRRAARNIDAGPIGCSKCHGGLERSIAELADVPRPKCEQKDLMLIQLDRGARSKSVAFNHKTHEARSRSCQQCHHQTLRPCRDCHTVEGAEEGGWITLAEAHHEVSSPLSCIGCHEIEKSKAECAGCHQLMPGGLVHAGCAGCHTGSLETLLSPEKVPSPEYLIMEGVEDKIEIKEIEKAYGPSKMPHLVIARKLTEVSNNSTLASSFHTEAMTVCRGCHHLGPLVARADTPPCVTCHTARDEPGSFTPTLLGAYHQQCLGCHRLMDPAGQKMPQTCTGCHEEKKSDQLAARLQE